MYRTKVLILTSDQTLKDQLHGYLANYPDKYTIFHQSEFVPNISTYDVAVIDENIIAKNPSAILADDNLNLNHVSIIYLTDALDDSEEYSAVKSLAADYLFKTQLTKSGLHNSIKYAVESRGLKREIQRQQKRYESLFHNAIDAAFVLTADWQIENVNEAFIKLFGWETSIGPGEIKNSKFANLINDEADYIQLVEDISGGKIHSIEREIMFNRAYFKGLFLGNLKISELKEYPTDDGESGQVTVGYHGTINNISYKKRLRTIKESSDRIAITYRLARTLAHEIRNPLTNITLAVNQLEDEIPKSDDTELYLGIIERSSKRIDSLIDRLLKSSEHRVLKFSEADIIQILNLAVEGAVDRAKLLDIKLIKDFEHQSIAYTCDSEKLQIAISSLITNALESLENNPGQVIVGQYMEDDYICIYVEDTGCGMTEENKKNVFDPFFTLKKNGVGLGLTDTLAVISEHTGQIEVDSEPGVGTTFTILLPRKQK